MDSAVAMEEEMESAEAWDKRCSRSTQALSTPQDCRARSGQKAQLTCQSQTTMLGTQRDTSLVAKTDLAAAREVQEKKVKRSMRTENIRSNAILRLPQKRSMSLGRVCSKEFADHSQCC